MEGWPCDDGEIGEMQLQAKECPPTPGARERRGRSLPERLQRPRPPTPWLRCQPPARRESTVCRFSPQCVVFVTAASETNTVRGGGGAVLSSYGEDSVGLRPWARPSETFLVLSFSSLGWSCLVLPPGQIRLWVTHRASLAGLC